LNPTLTKAVVVVTFALIFYTIGVITEQRSSLISRRVLLFLSLGVVFDISSTALMIVGSRKIPITVHGFIGYSALLLMLIETVLMWIFWKRHNKEQVSAAVNVYTKFAYGWWVIAYIAGAVIAMTLER
jgi:uncharacterized repeat protein (TIGR03987 family)